MELDKAVKSNGQLGANINGRSESMTRRSSDALTTATSDMHMRIRQARRVANLSQQALGQMIGVQRSAVSNWEANGTIHPSIQHLILIAVATHVSIEWLATGRGKMNPDYDPLDGIPAADVEVTETPQERELLQRFRRASPRAQLVLMNLMEVLVPNRKLKELGTLPTQ